MCHRCNYLDLLKTAGIDATAHRLRILKVIGNASAPLSAPDIFKTLRRTHAINRVTVYRILDTLVSKGLVDRLSGGGRAFFYGLAPNALHERHPHFYCRRCGQMDCLNPQSISMDMQALERIFPGKIDSVEVRVDGVCKKCLGAV